MNTVEIIFSPTGGTEKVAHIISRQWSESAVKIDLSDYNTDFSNCAIGKEDRVLIAMPSFGGRAPAVAIERLKKIAGNGAKCTLVCVYGNRAYEDTLAEMEDAANECGFKVVAAVAAIAQHSIIPKYAANRPDASDEKQLAEFARQIAEKKDTVTSIPGNRPYKKSRRWRTCAEAVQGLCEMRSLCKKLPCAGDLSRNTYGRYQEVHFLYALCEAVSP